MEHPKDAQLGSPIRLVAEWVKHQDALTRRMPSLYDTLGLSRGADASEIKKAYRKLAVEHHPDKGGDAERFKEVQKAYEILSDDHKRMIYDQTGQESNDAVQDFPEGMPFPMGGNPFAGQGVPFDIGNLFGMFGPRGPGPGGPRPPPRGKGPPKVHELPITLAEFFHGKDLNIKFERQKFCEACKGSGAEKYDSCGGCGGSGTKTQMMMIGPGMMAQMQRPCEECSTTGKRVSVVCSACAGKKFKAHEKSLSAKILPGMRPGEILVFPNECSDQPEFSESGDVHITIQEADEAIEFRRVPGTDNLHTTVRITLTSGLLGTTVTVPTHPAHPNGLAIPIPAGTQNGEVLQMLGEGLRQKSGGRGVLHVTVLVTVSPAERAILKDKATELAKLLAHVG